MAQWARKGKRRSSAGQWCSARLVDGTLQTGLYTWRGSLIDDVTTAATALREGASFVNVPNDKAFCNALRAQLQSTAEVPHG